MTWVHPWGGGGVSAGPAAGDTAQPWHSSSVQVPGSRYLKGNLPLSACFYLIVTQSSGRAFSTESSFFGGFPSHRLSLACKSRRGPFSAGLDGNSQKEAPRKAKAVTRRADNIPGCCLRFSVMPAPSSRGLRPWTWPAHPSQHCQPFLIPARGATRKRR